MMIDHRMLNLFGKKIFERAVMKAPFRVPVSMPNEACFYFMLRGRGEVIGSGGSFQSEEENGFVLRCGNYISEYCKTVETDTVEAVAVHFYPEIIQMIYDREFPDFLRDVQRVRPIRAYRIERSAPLRTYIDSLLFYFDNPELADEELLKLKMRELILLLVKVDPSETVKHLLADLFEPEALEFRQVVEANVYTNLTTAELAFLCKRSLSGFKREFTRLYATPPARYLRDRKLERAARLLRTTELRISDVAFDCGFATLAHFSRVFHQKYEQSPSEYRGHSE